MSKTQNIRMIFYSHPLSAQLLGEGLLDETRQNLIIEVAETSMLEYVCGGRARSSKGVLPLLTQPDTVDLFALADTYPLIPAPIVLAASPAIARHQLIHALMVLDRRPFDCENIYFMCHVKDALSFEALYAIVDRFSVVWNVGDYPTQELVECTQSLQRAAKLVDGRWGGLFVIDHRVRNAPGPKQEQNEARRAMATLV